MTATASAYITANAIERYIERVDPSTSWDQARARIQAAKRAIATAAAIGCKIVRLGDGAKLVLDHDRVITVLARHQIHAIEASKSADIFPPGFAHARKKSRCGVRPLAAQRSDPPPGHRPGPALGPSEITEGRS